MVVVSALPATANPIEVNNRLGSTQKVKDTTDYGLRNGSVIVVPIPFSNPVIGAGLSIGAGYIFQLAPDANTSFVGIGAMGSDNGSKAFGAAANITFGSGWKFDFALADADVRYDLFFNSIELPIAQTGLLLNSGVDYPISDALSAGVAIRYLDTNITLSSAGTSIPPSLIPDLSLELLSIGGRFEWDVRNDSDYPTDGARVNVAANGGFSLSGDTRSYGYAYLNYDVYEPMGERGVLAARVSTCAASSDAPFFDQCSLGFSDSFRGFSPTQYYDSRLVSGQVEYRQRVGNRFGFVAFGGVGWTGSSYGTLNDAGTRIAGGVGARYRVSQKFPVDFSVDVSINNDSEEFLYIYAGQRF